MDDSLVHVHLRLDREDWEFFKEYFPQGQATGVVRELIKRAACKMRLHLEGKLTAEEVEVDIKGLEPVNRS